ncbi:MAG: hypothetical protein LBI27_03865 [Clostridiales bacterium]|jgi:hypothetical protein|nr:hypothetical protein [Clostridiales bacterium]
MNKENGKEFLKVFGITAVSAGMLSAALVGINTIAFAASTGTAAILPPTATVVISGEQAPQEDFVEPELEVTMYPTIIDDVEVVPSANALAPDDAALHVARYIWKIFGESIDGKFVGVTYSALPSDSRVYWHCSVADSEEAFLDNQMCFFVSIDAVTGEGLSIYRTITTSAADNERLDEMRINDPINFVEQIRRIRPDPIMPEDVDESFFDIAKEYAALQFPGAEVVNAELSCGGSIRHGFDENGNLVATNHRISFRVSVDTGYDAFVTLFVDSGELASIHTDHNYDIPGFNLRGRG